MNAKYNNKNLGFTIVELLAVAVLMAMLTLGAGSAYLSRHKKALIEKTARQIILNAKYARTLAIERNRPCKMIIDKTSKQLWLTTEAFNEETGQFEEVVLNNRYSKRITLPGQITFEEVVIKRRDIDGPEAQLFDDIDDPEASSEIVFFPNGTATSSVICIGDGKNHYTITTSEATGRVKSQYGKSSQMVAETIDLDEQ